MSTSLMKKHMLIRNSLDSTKPNRDVNIDLARVIAALFVIYVHSSVAWIHNEAAGVWFVANLTNGIGHVSVPLFLMMSGSLVIGRPIEDYIVYLRKRAASTLRPYIVGTAVYFFVDKIFSEGTTITAHTFIQNFILGASYMHLYFLFVLLGMYMLAPLLQGIRSASSTTIVGTLAVLFGLAGLGRVLWPFGFVLGYLSLGTCFNFLPYFLSGYVLRYVAKPADRWHLPIFALPIIIGMLASWFMSPVLSDNFLQYDSPTVMIASVGAFCLLMRISIRGILATNLISRIADLTLGIYVLHLAVLIGMEHWLPPVIGPVWQVAFFPPLCFVLTAMIVYALHLIPGVKGWI